MLMVLKRPDIPLHTKGSENDIRAKSLLGLLGHAQELAAVVDGIGDFVSDDEVALGFHSTLNVVGSQRFPWPCRFPASSAHRDR